MQRYYQIVTAGTEADVYIFGDIVTPDWQAISEKWFGDESETSGLSLVKDLQKLDADVINVHINSYGGDVSEGLACYNALKQHKAKIRTYNDGFCCSAAVLPWLAGDERIASSASAFLFHQAWSYGSGNADELRALADELDMLTDLTMVPYMTNAKISEDEMRAVFKAGKFLSPAYVAEIGLATRVEDYQTSGNVAASARGGFFEQLLSGKAEPVADADMSPVLEKLAELNQKIDALAAPEFLQKKMTVPEEQPKTTNFFAALMGTRGE